MHKISLLQRYGNNAMFYEAPTGFPKIISAPILRIIATAKNKQFTGAKKDRRIILIKFAGSKVDAIKFGLRRAVRSNMWRRQGREFFGRSWSTFQKRTGRRKDRKRMCDPVRNVFERFCKH